MKTIPELVAKVSSELEIGELFWCKGTQNSHFAVAGQKIDGRAAREALFLINKTHGHVSIGIVPDDMHVLSYGNDWAIKPKLSPERRHIDKNGDFGIAHGTRVIFAHDPRSVEKPECAFDVDTGSSTYSYPIAFAFTDWDVVLQLGENAELTLFKIGE